MKKIFKPRLFLPLFLVIFTFTVYWLTKPPSILYIDSGTMIGASYTLGIPNPPGFPFYMMASHIFAILPIFNVLTRLELFTIVFSVFAVFILYKIILLLIENDFFFHKTSKNILNLNTQKTNYKYLASFAGASSLAFSYQYWSQSQNTEAFIFTDFFLILFLYILLFIEKKRNDALQVKGKTGLVFADYFFKILLLLAFLYGLASGANPTIAVLVPGVLFVMFLNRKLLNIKKLIILFLVFLITISLVYSYLPLRASTWPFVNWGNPQTLKLFIGHIRGEGLNIYQPDSGAINGFTGSPLVFIQSVSNFFYLLLIQFTPFLVPFMFLGAYFIFKKNKYLFSLLISVPIIDIVYSGIYLSGNQESWFILSWIICAIFIAIGFYFVLLRFNLNKNLIRVLFFIWLIPLAVWFVPLNRSEHYYSSDYANNLYLPLKKDAILIGSGDFSNSLGYYLHEADKLRPDVLPVIANTFYVNKWYRDSLRHIPDIKVSNEIENIIKYKDEGEYNRAMNEFIADNIDKHPIYVTHLTLRASVLAGTNKGRLVLDSRFKFVPHGLSLEVVKSNSESLPDTSAFNYSFRNQNPEKRPFYLEKNYNNSFFNMKNEYAYGWEELGDWFLEKKDYNQALYYYQQARHWLPNDPEILSRFGQYYGVIGEYDISRQYLEKVLRIEPKSASVRYNLAISLANLGRINEAIQQYEIIQQISNDQTIIQRAKEQEQLLLSPQEK